MRATFVSKSIAMPWRDATIKKTVEVSGRRRPRLGESYRSINTNFNIQKQLLQVFERCRSKEI